jgi:deazaflavin-dependent oxidoreductase (nitroreductase family)
MGLVQALEYALPTPNAVQRAMWHVSSARRGAWLFARSLPQIDKLVLRISRGQVTLTGVTGGIPVVTITTTGARSGQRRTTPLMGVPFRGDIAIIGAHFGQPGAPGWYYNLRAQPRAEVTYRNRTAACSADRRPSAGTSRSVPDVRPPACELDLGLAGAGRSRSGHGPPVESPPGTCRQARA